MVEFREGGGANVGGNLQEEFDWTGPWRYHVTLFIYIFFMALHLWHRIFSFFPLAPPPCGEFVVFKEYPNQLSITTYFLVNIHYTEVLNYKHQCPLWSN